MVATNLDKKFPVIEIFGPTIQGEGLDAGRPCIFVRFGGCDFRCWWCDSMHAVDPEQVRQNRTMMDASEILTVINDLNAHPDVVVNPFSSAPPPSRGVNWVIFSGGNPALHDLEPLIELLHSVDYKISVETQGSRYKPWLKQCDLICLSPKGPSARMTEKMDRAFGGAFFDIMQDLDANGNQYFIKVPIFNADDLEFLADLVETYQEYDIPFFASVGNKWAPGSDMVNEETFEIEDETSFKLGVLETAREVSEEIYSGRWPLLAERVRIIPQIHTLYWANEKGR